MPAAPNAPLRPAVLSPGDHVRFVSPASWPSAEHGLDEAMETVRSWGLEAELAPHALDRHGYMAGTDSDRLLDLNEALRDPTIRAVFATRGGAGSYRIADGLDLDAVRADPKPIVGFSDITNVQMTLWGHTGLSSVHGALAGPLACDDVRQLLMTTDSVTIEADPAISTSTLTTTGTAAGPLVGGNLREFASMVGVALPDLAGAVLFLEDLRHIGIGQVDRNVTQLLRAGIIDDIAGVVLGHFAGFDGYVDRDWTLLDVLADRLGPLGVPILGGVPAGHGVEDANGESCMRSLSLGVPCRVDADAGSITMESCVQ